VPQDDEALVVDYLGSFPIVLDVMERLPDVIDGSEVAQTASLRKTVCISGATIYSTMCVATMCCCLVIFSRLSGRLIGR
jgi:hypothetical protein